MIGTTVSRYRILSKLGGGGMGVVYEAEDSVLGRHVAIKFLPEETAKSADALERFQREARVASALNHPHICVVYDIGTHEGEPYLVMERLSGQTLRHVIGNQPMTIDRVVALGEQIADALDAAHGAGIVHRDLKPDNLFVTERGEAKVLDFGLAKLGAMASGSEVDTAAPTAALEFVTAAGTTLGTAAYMSPEQARGQAVDARSDLFSLGVVLYEMATGRRPFAGATPVDLLISISTSEPTPPSDMNVEVPAGLEEIILHALEKDPARRCQSAAELRSDLLRLQSDAAVSTTARSSSRKNATPWLQEEDSPSVRRRPLVSLIAASLVALAGIGYVLTGGGESAGTKVEAGAPAAAAAASAADHSIAVLPFADMSPGRDQEYFSDGIAEELLNLLAKIPQLQVTARTSSFAFKGKELGIREIARQLRVAHVLEGSVRKAGDQVRITAQLIDAVTDAHLWSQTYDRKLDDIFAIQDEIAVDVVEQLKVTLLGAVPKARETDPEAYALYLQAVQLGRQITAEGFEQSDALYRKVLAIDPRYAPAWDNLATNFVNEAGQGLLSNKEGNDRAREAARQALEIDPNYAPAHSSLGWIAMFGDNDLAGAAQHFERALALDPADLSVLGGSAVLLHSLGRLDEALALYEAVVRRDPVNVTNLFNLAGTQRFAGRLDAAIASYRTGMSLSPGRGGAHCNLALAQLQKGDAKDALAEIELETSDPLKLIGLSMAYHALGRSSESEAALAGLIAEYEKDWAYNIAYVYASRGEADRAFAWLDKAVETGDPGLSDIVLEPLFDTLHIDPRWLPLLRKLGKAPGQLAKIPFKVTLPK